jgi:outer membrane lipoprotein-sorting protein
MRRFFPLLLWCVCAALPAWSTEPLKDVLARIDKSAAEFRGMTAMLTKITYTAVIQDKSEEQGLIAMRMGKNREMEVKIEFTQPDPKTWAFHNHIAEEYLPKIKIVRQYDLSKHSALINQYLLLGFGSSSKELEKNYTMTVGGEESVEAQKTTRVELVPLSEGAKQYLKRVEIWFSATSGNPVQQKFYQNSGDYYLMTYTDTKMDPNLQESAVRLKLPSGVKREFPQR